MRTGEKSFALRLAPLRLLIAGLALILLVGNGASPAAANTITVNSTVDAVDASPSDGICATAAGQCSLRAAIQEANALPGPDVITLPSGTYTLTIAGQGENVAASGDLNISDDLQIRGAGAATTIIDGNGLDYVLDVQSGSSTVSNVTIQGAASTHSGVLNLNRGTLTLDDSIITGNANGFGVNGIINLGTLTVNGGSITRNGATGHGTIGGGMSNEGTATLTDVTVSDNTADQGGGVFNTGTLSLTNVTVEGNSASFVGGIFNAAGTATLDNVTIDGNTADLSAGTGAGIFNGGTATLTDVTISSNRGVNGVGGVANDGSATVKNTIVEGNTGGNCGGSRRISSSGHNLEDADTCGFTGPGDLVNTDPGLGPLADNGGRTETRALLPGSPAIDAGSTDCPPPATDQRGVARPVDGDGDGGAVCDIGAFEFQPPQPTPTAEPPMPSPTPADSLAASPVASVAALPRTGGAPGGNQEVNAASLSIGGLLIALGMTSLFLGSRRRPW